MNGRQLTSLPTDIRLQLALFLPLTDIASLAGVNRSLASLFSLAVDRTHTQWHSHRYLGLCARLVWQRHPPLRNALNSFPAVGDSVDTVAAAAFSRVVGFCQRLREVDLTSSCITNRAISVLTCASASHLELVRLTGCRQLSLSSTLRSLRQCPLLAQVIFTQCFSTCQAPVNADTPEGQLHLTKHFPVPPTTSDEQDCEHAWWQLRNVRFEQCGVVDGPALEYVLSNAPRLRSLAIVATELQQLAAIRSTRCFAVWHVTKLDLSDAPKLIKAMELVAFFLVLTDLTITAAPSREAPDCDAYYAAQKEYDTLLMTLREFPDLYGERLHSVHTLAISCARRLPGPIHMCALPNVRHLTLQWHPYIFSKDLLSSPALLQASITHGVSEWLTFLHCGWKLETFHVNVPGECALTIPLLKALLLDVDVCSSLRLLTLELSCHSWPASAAAQSAPTVSDYASKSAAAEAGRLWYELRQARKQLEIQFIRR